MYSNIQQNFIAETQEYYQQNYNQQKRLREEEQENQNNITNNMLKRRQPKTLFRPWGEEETKPNTSQEVANHKKATPTSPQAYQPQLTLNTAPYQLTPYQMAVQQQQRHATLAIQQAMYQRQLLMAQAWAQHRQQQHHHQMMLHHQQQQMRQQMFAFGQQQGHK